MRWGREGENDVILISKTLNSNKKCWRPFQKSTTNQNAVVESSPRAYIHKTLSDLSDLRDHCRRETGKIVRPRVSGNLL